MVFLCCAVGAYVKTYELSSDAMRLHRAMSSLNAEVTCARYNHNGKIVASCSVDGGICLDVATSGELLSRFFYPAKTATDRRVNAVHFSSGSRFLASGGSDGCVRIWDLKTQEVSQTYSISASAVTSVTFSGYKDDFIVAGSESGAISVCDVQSNETTGILSVDPKFRVASVTSVVASQHPYARQVVGSTYADGSVRVWDLHMGKLSVEFVHQHDDAASCLAISPVSKVLLASGGLDRRVLFFDTLQRKELRSMDLDTPVTALALCADGKTLAVGTTNGAVFVYDLRGAITPLYTSIVCDGTASGTAVVNSLQFATPSSDNSNATVFPTGQPVIATQRTNGGGALSSSARDSPSTELQPPRPSSTMQLFDNAHQPEAPSLISPPIKSSSNRPSRFTISTNQVSPGETQPFPSNQAMTELAILQQHDEQQQQQLATPSLLNSLPQTGSARLGESPSHNNGEPSLLSMLAEPSPPRTRPQPMVVNTKPANPPLPLTSPTSYTTRVAPTTAHDRELVVDQVQQFRNKLNKLHADQDLQLTALLETVLAKYDAVAEENSRLRRENESLRAHLQEHYTYG